MIVNTTATTAEISASVLVLTGRHSAEMQPALDALSQFYLDAEVRTLSDVATAVEQITSNHWFPDLVIICQHRPGEFTAAEAHTLLSLLPLARWICLRGSWCESDGRNGSPWPEAICVRARSAASRIELEQRVLKGEVGPLPLTASRDEVLEFDLQHSATTRVSAGIRAKLNIAVLTSDPDLRRAITDLLTTNGLNVVTSSEACAAVAVWDIDPILPDRWPHAEVSQQNSSPQVTIAISSMAYPADVEQLQTIGVSAVIDKSTLAVTLIPAIEAVIIPIT